MGSKGVRKLIQVMGVLNVTPDSFSDGGELKNERLIKQKVLDMINAGVGIIDVGGESTRPGHKEVKAKEEIRRVLPAIKIIREISTDVSISIDTQKAEVAEKALQAGATIINDVSALADQKMPEVIKKFDCQVILMRNRPLDEEDLVGSCKNQFEEIVEKCLSLGISKEKIILDPGLGFGDLASGDFSSLPGGNPAANTQLVLSANDYSLGLPVLIGASRKRFLGEMSGQKNAKDRLAESLSFAVLAAYSGASIIRVHDVVETIKALQES
jgi:dihydropteroate synthase